MILPSDKDSHSDHDTKSDSGVTSYTATTDSPFKADTPAQMPVARAGSWDYASPPPYSGAGPSSPPTSPPAGPPSARVNHLHLSKDNNSVKGYYTVDVDLVVPPQLIPNVVSGADAENLKLYSHNGNVSADVNLIGRGDKRATLVAESKNGSAQLKVLSRINCPFRLFVSSHNGAVKVGIPRDFVGPITSSTNNGALCLSDAIQRNYTPFSEDKKMSKGFIGDWSSCGYGDIIQSGGEWNGDELVVGSRNGNVKVYYTDELTGPSSGGFFSSLFKGR